MYLDYVWEQLFKITESYFTETSTLQEKIYNNYISQHFKVLMDEMREKKDLNKLVKKLNEKAINNDEYTIAQIIDLIEKNNSGINLTDEEAIIISKSIFSLYTDICRLTPINIDEL